MNFYDFREEIYWLMEITLGCQAVNIHIRWSFNEFSHKKEKTHFYILTSFLASWNINTTNEFIQKFKPESL